MYTSRLNQGHEHEWLNDDRHDKAKASSSGGDETGLERGLGAVQMGLIYVNPVSLHRVLFNSSFHYNLSTHIHSTLPSR